MKHPNDILYGVRPAIEALRGGRRRVRRLWLARASDAAGPLQELEALAAQLGVAIRATTPAHLDRLALSRHHQGVVAEVDSYPYLALEALLSAERPTGGDPLFLLALDHIQDPQNMGSLLRTAECAGVHGVIVPQDRAVLVTPAVVKASAGATERLRLARVVNMARALRELKDEGVRVVGLENLPEAVRYDEADLGGPLALVLGNEGKGLSRLARETCDALLRIPLSGRIDSLNVSVAGAVAMYEVRRQRGRR
jgi:23S rRNA (guanosine2251-2'-O)-methyltransferase